MWEFKFRVTFQGENSLSLQLLNCSPEGEEEDDGYQEADKRDAEANVGNDSESWSVHLREHEEMVG